MASSGNGCMRVVIVDPSFASGVGHHQQLNASLLAALQAAGHSAEVWGDAALPEASNWRRVSSGCGYVDQRHWADLAGSLHLAARLRRQLEAATAADTTAGKTPADAWLAHSLLPFQLIGLAQLLQRQPPARVVLSLMFAPGETLGGCAGLEPAQLQHQAGINARTALQALAQVVRQGGHQLVVGAGSQQTLALYGPLLEAAGLAPGCLHPAVVGAGSQVKAPAPSAEPRVLLHWGDFKADKGRQEAVALLQALLEKPANEHLAYRWLFHGHSNNALPASEQAVLEQAQRQFDDRFLWLQEDLPGDQMQHLLASCDLALLAYNPFTYAQRSSGVLWCYAAARYSCNQAATAMGYSSHWLAQEAQALGMRWIPAPQGTAATDGATWLALLNQGLSLAQTAQPQWTPTAALVLGERFDQWVLHQLKEQSR